MKIIYHKTEAARVIPLEDDIPEGWAETPAAFGVITCPSQEQLAAMAAQSEPEPAPAVDERGALLEEAAQRGIPVDRRWGVEKLRAALNGDGT